MNALPLVAAWQRSMHLVLTELDDALAGLGLSAGEFNALACFAGERSRSVRELVEATGQRPSTLTGVLDRLERKRLVRRRVNAADRRSFTIELTAAGGRAAARVHTAFAALDGRVRDDLPAEAVDGFHHVLDAIEQHTTKGTV